VTSTDEIGWVGTPETLERLVAALQRTSLAAVDTEFVREKTYYPQLCLIQIATTEDVACIDCLAPLDLTPVFAELFRPDFTWVLHSARQDLEVVWQRTRRLPPRLIDTQIAAALCGYPPQVGLETLLNRTLGVELGESFARTDWSRRPLPDAPLRYALDDVRHLLAAWACLESRLAELGRSAWLDEDCARVLAEPPETEPSSVWARLKGAQGLPLAGQCAALALVHWRETAAQRADRPRRWLLPDEVLLSIAATLPDDPEALARLVSPKFAARNAGAVLAALATRNKPGLIAEVRASSSQAVADKALVKGLQERVRGRAAQLEIEPEILATRRDLVAVAAGRPPAHLLTGWRAAELGSLLERPAPAAGGGTGGVAIT
jgi:ribonuclease D